MNVCIYTSLKYTAYIRCTIRRTLDRPEGRQEGITGRGIVVGFVDDGKSDRAVYIRQYDAAV